MTREKVIHRVIVKPVNEMFQVVFVLSSAGTYIKEFIHGDLGRTLPNFGTLFGTEADIFQLDVLDLYETMNEENMKSFEELTASHLIDILN